MRAVPQLCRALCNCVIALWNCQRTCTAPVKTSEPSLWREVNLTYKLLSAKMNGAHQRADEESSDLTLLLTDSVYPQSSFSPPFSVHGAAAASSDVLLQLPEILW